MMRPKRHHRHVTGSRRIVRNHPSERLSMDFMSDELYNGQRIRFLTLVDNYTREILAIEVDEHLGA